MVLPRFFFVFFLAYETAMSTEIPADAPTINPPAGAASVSRGEEFSPEQLALIDCLITARVAAATTGSFGRVDAPSTSTTEETGEFLTFSVLLAS